MARYNRAHVAALSGATTWLCATLWGFAALAQEVDLDLPSVVQGLRHRESAVQNAAVHARLEKLQRVGIKETAPLAPLKFVTDQTWDSQGRVRYELKGQRAGKGRGEPYYILDYQESLAFDAESTHSMEGEGDRGYLQGSIRAGSQMSWPVDPREFDSYYFGKAVSATFDKGEAVVVGWEEFEGRRVLLIQLEYRVTGELKFPELHHFWIDPDRGFIVVKKVYSSKKPGTDPWFVYTRIESTEHTEVQPGIWMPGRGRHEHYTDAKNGPPPPPLLWHRIEVEFSDWRLNRDLPADTFTMKFAPGITIFDERTGKRFQANAIDDSHLQAQSARAQQLAMELANMPPNEEIARRLSPNTQSRMWLYLTLVGAVLAIAGAGIYARHLWAARRKSP